MLFWFLYSSYICVGAWLRFMQLRNFFRAFGFSDQWSSDSHGRALSYSKVKIKILENVANEIFVFVGCKCESRFNLLAAKNICTKYLSYASIFIQIESFAWISSGPRVERECIKC